MAELEVWPNTRVLLSTYGYVGRSVADPQNKARKWSVITELAPLSTYKPPRLRCVDQLGFVSFISVSDFSLLAYLAKPGELDPWRMEHYPEVGDYGGGWEGFYAKPADLDDDLHLRELELRQAHGWQVLPKLELKRYVHMEHGRDVEALEMLLWDADRTTGLGPDARISTLSTRWVRVETREVTWAG